MKDQETQAYLPFGSLIIVQVVILNDTDQAFVGFGCMRNSNIHKTPGLIGVNDSIHSGYMISMRMRSDKEINMRYVQSSKFLEDERLIRSRIDHDHFTAGSRDHHRISLADIKKVNLKGTRQKNAWGQKQNQNQN